MQELGKNNSMQLIVPSSSKIEDRFKEKSNPAFSEKILQSYPTSNGSDQFHVMVFKPNAESFRGYIGLALLPIWRSWVEVILTYSELITLNCSALVP